jgi:hypothetical protein
VYVLFSLWSRGRLWIDAFVHEGITTGLKGGRLLLDDEDLDTMHDSIHNRSMVVQNSTLQTSVKFATAPINLALACRLINRALSGPSARRSRTVNGNWVKEAWEALERSWEEFEALKLAPEATVVYTSMDDVVRFADGWVSYGSDRADARKSSCLRLRMLFERY